MRGVRAVESEAPLGFPQLGGPAAFCAPGPGLPERGYDAARSLPGRVRSCIKYRMVHLNITLDEELYRRLKARAPAKKLSAFIAAALHERLGPSDDELAQAYREAAKEPWRRTLAEEWNPTEVEAWPQ